MTKRILLYLGWSMAAVLSPGGAMAQGTQPDAVVAADVAPVRAWRAFRRQLDADSLAAPRIDEQRFEATVSLPGAGEVQVDIDWDERSGGSRLAWRTASPAAASAAAGWMARIAERARGEAQDNHLCRGDHPGDLPEPSMEGPVSCSAVTGRFSSALFELEKCGDYESALRILAACVKERHGGGLIRLASFYENGMGLPQREERMTEYLRQAAESATPGYAATARVQYATALYFGIGTPPDRQRAVSLLDEAARAGNQDAAHFLRHGYHTAWRRQDGGFYADPGWRAAGAGAE